MTEQQIQDNIADSQPEVQAERQYAEEQAERRAGEAEQRMDSYREERADYIKDKYTPDPLEACLLSCDTYDEFCQKCNKLLNKQDALPIDLWNEYWERYKE